MIRKYPAPDPAEEIAYICCSAPPLSAPTGVQHRDEQGAHEEGEQKHEHVYVPRGARQAAVRTDEFPMAAMLLPLRPRAGNANLDLTASGLVGIWKCSPPYSSRPSTWTFPRYQLP